MSINERYLVLTSVAAITVISCVLAEILTCAVLLALGIECSITVQGTHITLLTELPANIVVPIIIASGPLLVGSFAVGLALLLRNTEWRYVGFAGIAMQTLLIAKIFALFISGQTAALSDLGGAFVFGVVFGLVIVWDFLRYRIESKSSW